jgi:hypothetical protein
VPSHPGVCNTCGENVFQCHKCRSINYDERDPFLCNSCGFCKFAKFDFTIVGKPCCAVDTIETEDDRKQTLQAISNLLERADKIYNSLSQHIKPALEVLLVKLNDQNVLEKFTNVQLLLPPNQANENLTSIPTNSQIDSQQLNYSNLLNHAANNTIASTNNSGGIIGIRSTPLTVINSNGTSVNNANIASTTTTPASKPPLSSNIVTNTSNQSQIDSGSFFVNKTIQSIVQKYTLECKSKFDELSKIVLKLNLCRKELREYDKQFKSNFSNQVSNQLSTGQTFGIHFF